MKELPANYLDIAFATWGKNQIFKEDLGQSSGGHKVNLRKSQEQTPYKPSTRHKFDVLSTMSCNVSILADSQFEMGPQISN